MCGLNKAEVVEGDISKSDIQQERSKKKIVRKSSSSLKKDLKEYYLNSPERKNRVLIVNRKNFFNDSESGKESEKKY